MSRRYSAKPVAVEVEPVRFAQWRGDLHAPYRPWPDLWRRFKLLNWFAKSQLLAGVGIYVVSLFLPDALNLIGLADIALFGNLIRKQADPSLADLAPSPLPPDHYPVRLELTCSGTAYGEDDGIATFHEGWLLFEGTACSFSVRSTDGKVLWKAARNERRNKESEWLQDEELRLVFGAVTARFIPYAGIRTEDASMNEVGSRFARRVRSWSAERTPEGTPIYPPAFGLPHTLGWNRVSGMLLGTTLWLMILPMVLAFARNPPSHSIGYLAFLAVPLFLVGSLMFIRAQRMSESLLRDLAKFRESAQKGLSPLP